MVIPSSSSHVVNIRFISKALIYLSSILVLLSTATCAIYEGDEFENNIKSATFVSKTFEVGPGTVAEKTLLNIDFPRGHIGVKSFHAEVVDEEGNSVPLYEAYLHHWFAIRYYEKIWSMSPIPKDPKKPYDGVIFKRNDGTCNGGTLPHYWGFGSESRGTSTKIPDPYAVELGNPEYTPPGHEEKWLFNLMVIDTRGTKYRKGCTECRCDLFNLPENFFNVTTGIDGKPLDPDYKGGLFCCKDNFQCKLKEGFEAPNRTLALRYKITWVDWNQHQIPLRFYILDATDRVRTNGSNIIHDCQAEYTITESDFWDNSPHVQKANIPMVKGGYLIYATSHVHSGVIATTLYRQDGKTLCTSKPKYGKGKEPGNEKGYVVGMSVCYPEPGSIKIKDGETLTVESKYKRRYITGAMGHTYIYLADRLPEDIYTPLNGSCIELGELVYEPPRDGPTLWEIGIPDRSAAEFYVPDPNPQYINRLFINHPDRFRQYGLWDRYTELYPDADLVYTIGVSDYTKDWFFAHVPRKREDNTHQGTTWQIKFEVSSVIQGSTYKLRVALASATLAELQIRVNDPNARRPLFTSGLIGRENSIARHGIHGLYWLYHVDIPSSLLTDGANILYFTQPRCTSPFQGIMYDYIRLEGPPCFKEEI